MGRSQRRSSVAQQHGAGRSSNPHKPILAERFKTKMCEKFSSEGACDYEARCMFAHGDHELRTKEQNIADDLVTEEAIKAFQKARVIAAKSAQKKRDREERAGTGRTTATATPRRSSSAVSATSMVSQRERRGSTVSTVAAASDCGNPATRPSSTVPNSGAALAVTGVSDGDGSFAAAAGCCVDRRVVYSGGLPGVRRCTSPQTGLSVSFVDTPPATALRTPPWSVSFGACGVDLYALSPSPAPPCRSHTRGWEVAPLMFSVDPPPPPPPAADDDVTAGMSQCASVGTPSHQQQQLLNNNSGSVPNGSFLPSARVSASTATLDDDFFLAASFTSERGGCAALLFKAHEVATTATPRKLHVTYDTTKFVSPLAAAMLSQRKVVSEECHCAVCAAGGADHDAEILLA